MSRLLSKWGIPVWRSLRQPSYRPRAGRWLLLPRRRSRARASPRGRYVARIRVGGEVVMAKTPSTPVKAARRLSGSSRSAATTSAPSSVRARAASESVRRANARMGRSRPEVRGRSPRPGGRSHRLPRSVPATSRRGLSQVFLPALPQDRFEVLSVFAAHGGSPFGWNSPGSTSGGLAHVNPLLKISCRAAGHYQGCRQAGEEASPDHGDSRDRSIGFECVSVTTRSAARPRPPVTARRQPLHAPGPAGANHSVSRSWRTNSPLRSRPAYPLSIARESPESGDDLSPAWQRASIRREGSHGHQGRARRCKGRYP